MSNRNKKKKQPQIFMISVKKKHTHKSSFPALIKLCPSFEKLYTRGVDDDGTYFNDDNNYDDPKTY